MFFKIYFNLKKFLLKSKNFDYVNYFLDFFYQLKNFYIKNETIFLKNVSELNLEINKTLDVDNCLLYENFNNFFPFFISFYLKKIFEKKCKTINYFNVLKNFNTEKRKMLIT